MKRGPSPVGGGGATSKARYDSDDEKAPTDLDVNFLREQNKQLAASLFSYRRKLERSDSELGILRTRADSDASSAAAVLRQWEVLNQDLLELVRAAGLSEEKALKKEEEEDHEGRASDLGKGGDGGSGELGTLRRTISDGADLHLLVNVPPPAAWKDRNLLLLVKDEEDKAAAEGGEGGADGDEEGAAAAAAAMQDDDGGDAADARRDLVGAEVRHTCRRSHALLATLLTAPAFSREAGALGTAGGSDGGGCSVVESALRNRALQAEVELLRDKLGREEHQNKLDQALVRQAQSECHHAQRALDLFRAESCTAANGAAAAKAAAEGGVGGADSEGSLAATPSSSSSVAASLATPASSFASSSSSSFQVPPTPVSSAAPASGVGGAQALAAMLSPGTPAHVPAPPPSAVQSSSVVKPLASSSSWTPSVSMMALATTEEGEEEGQVEEGNVHENGGHDGDDQGAGGEVSEELGNALQMASTRLRQLERAREELKAQADALSSALAAKAQLEHDLKARGSSGSGGGGSGGSGESARLLSRAQGDAERERSACRQEREASARLGEDLRRLNERCVNAEARYEEWVGGAGKKLREEVALAKAEANAKALELAQAASGLRRLEDCELENEALKRQVVEYGSLVGEEQRRQTASRAEAQSAREQETLVAQDAAQARKTAQVATETAAAAAAAAAAGGRDGTAASADEALTAALAGAVATLEECSKRLRGGCSDGGDSGGGSGGGSAAELEAQRAMNEAMIAELENMAKAQDELATQNARLLAVGTEQEDVNRLLMMRARQLREGKDAQQEEREGLAQKVAAYEARLHAVDELCKAKDGYLRAAEGARRERDGSLLSREQALSSATAAANKSCGEVAELRLAQGKEQAAAEAHKARATTLAEEAKELRTERDSLEEQLDDKQRRLDKTARRLEKEKAKKRSSSAAAALFGGGGGNGGGGGGDSGVDDEKAAADKEYRELIEYQIDELTKQTKCSILKEKDKDVMLVKCGHAFSRDAIDKRLADRMRRCPACNKSFATDDVKSLYLTW